MKWNEILECFESLASSQGFYGRVLESIYNLDDETLQNVIEEFESQNFSDVVDLILFMEG